jgi:K+-transporting ATPase ATPase C chain
MAIVQHLRPALVMVAAFTLLTGLAYPLAVTGVAQVMFPVAANGNLIVKDNKVVGSTLIGQAFKTDRYFHPRPSATTDTDPDDSSKTVDAPYNASSSGGSNLGPIAKKLLDRVQAEINALRDTGVAGPIPVDAVTASASGLDPHISPEAALLQVARVAKARKLPEERVRALVAAHIDDRALGLLGEPRVNVLLLNLALDALPQ